MLSAALAIAVAAALALLAAGAWLLITKQDRKRGWLMLAVAVVTLFNVWSWSGLPAAL